MIQFLDRLSLTNLPIGKKASWTGLLGTLVIAGLCLAIFVPAIQSYLAGNYYQSQYSTNKNQTGFVYSKSDFKMAIVIKNKLTGKVYNHTEILSLLKVQVIGWTVENTNYEPLVPCNNNYFVGDINGEYLEDCLIIPDSILMDVAFNGFSLAELQIYIQTPTIDIPFPQYTQPQTLAQLYYNQLNNNSYVQFYFTSKVVTPSNQVQFQVHKIYTSQFAFTLNNIWASVAIFQGHRLTMMDDSIMPWRNNRNISTLNWNGNQLYRLVSYNAYSLCFDDTLEIAVRYYNKLDWLLGIIGGGMFFFFIIFWCIFNPLNRWLQKIQLVPKLFLKKLTFQDPLRDEDLVPLNVSPGFILRRLWPFCKDKKTQRIIATSQRQNDIVLLLKKLKVAKRNLQKKELLAEFKTKFIAFPGDDLSALNRYLKGNHNDQLSSIQQSQSSENSSQPQNGNNVLQDQSGIQLQQDGQAEIVEAPEQPLDNIFSTQRQQLINRERKEEQKKQEEQVRQEEKKQKEDRQNGTGQLIKQQQPPISPQIQSNKILTSQIHEDNHLYRNRILLPHITPEHLPPLTVVISNHNQQIMVNQPQQIFQVQRAEVLQPPLQGERTLVERLNQNQVQALQNREEVMNEETALKQQEIVFQETQQLDEKFNLNSQQLLVLRQNRELQQILQTNPTYWAFKQNKPRNYKGLLEINKYDQYEGHFPLKKISCRAMIANKIVSFFKWLDVFWVRVNFIEKESGSNCGFFLTFLIVAASILTFALTIYNMNSIQYQIDKQFVQPEEISFSGNTSDSLNIIVCTNDYTLFTGSGQIFSLNYFVNTSGKVTTLSPVQMSQGDNTFNISANPFWYYYNPNCFKMPINIPIVLNSTSYFGYTITPYCPGTTAACSAARNTFVNTSTYTFIDTNLPANTIDFNSTSLVSKLSDKKSTTFNYIPFTINTMIQETIFAEIVQLRDNSGNQFLGPTSKLITSNINVGLDTSKQFIRSLNGSSPSYTFSLRPYQSKTVYTLSQRKLSFIVGIIGGVFVFWFSIIGSLGFFYNKFNYYMFVAQQLYEEQGYDDFLLSKLAAALRIPKCLLPKCCDIRDDIQRMKGVSTKIEKSLNHVSLLKYTDNVYRLSSSFFNNIYLKHLSLLHFKQKIDQASRIAEVVKVQQNQQPQFMSAYDEAEDDERDKSALLGKIANETRMSLANFQQTYNKEIEEAQKQAVIQYERYNQNIIEDSKPCCSSVPDFFDIFQEPASFTFKQSRKIESCFGGVLTLIVIGLVLIVVIRPLLLYFTSAGRTVSYQTAIDDLSPDDNGITFITGTNFKLGVTALNVTNMMPSNISAYINSTVGISILAIQTNKTIGNLSSSQTMIDLVPCPSNYLNSWLSPLATAPADNFQYAYCVPDGVSLQISGLPTDQLHNYFKLSIYDKSNTTNGYKNMSYLMGNYTFQIHYSSPESNYVDQSMKYFVWSTIFDLPGKTHLTLPIQRNMTLSKINITYDGDYNQWRKSKLNQITYAYDDFVTQRMNYAYVRASTANLWYNISFSFNQRMLIYNVITPKFYEVWGLVGGAIAFFFFIASCLATSFNNYKMRYLIGRELYNFDKLKDGSVKLKKRKADKQTFDEINNYGEGKILMAYFLSGLGRLINNYEFNDTLRRITLIQNKIEKDLDLVEFYKTLYIVRESINKELQKRHHIFRRIKPTDLYLKHIYNPSPVQFNYQPLLNYAKQNNLSSFQQMAVLQAKESRINIREVFDSKFLAKTFGLEDDNRSAHLHNMQETIGSLNSNSVGVISVGEGSVAYD